MSVLLSFFTSQLSRPTQPYLMLQEHLDAVAPGHPYVFVGSPVSDVIHPLIQQTQYDRQQLMLNLAAAWDAFGVFCDENILPAFAQGKSVILDGCGMDLLFAFSMMVPPEDRDHLWDAHHEFVQKVLTTRGISPPNYLIVSAPLEHEFVTFTKTDPTTFVSLSEYEDYLSVLEDFMDSYLAHPKQRPSVRVSTQTFSDHSIVDDLVRFLLPQKPREHALQQERENVIRVAA